MEVKASKQIFPNDLNALESNESAIYDSIKSYDNFLQERNVKKKALFGRFVKIGFILIVTAFVLIGVEFLGFAFKYNNDAQSNLIFGITTNIGCCVGTVGLLAILIVPSDEINLDDLLESWRHGLLRYALAVIVFFYGLLMGVLTPYTTVLSSISGVLLALPSSVIPVLYSTRLYLILASIPIFASPIFLTYAISPSFSMDHAIVTDFGKIYSYLDQSFAVALTFYMFISSLVMIYFVKFKLHCERESLIQSNGIRMSILITLLLIWLVIVSCFLIILGVSRLVKTGIPGSLTNGCIILPPVLFVLLIGEKRLFHHIASKFESTYAEKDGAFMAELVASNNLRVGDVWWIQRKAEDSRFESGIRALFMMGKVLRRKNDIFIVDVDLDLDRDTSWNPSFKGPTLVFNSNNTFVHGRNIESHEIDLKSSNICISRHALLDWAHQNLRFLNSTHFKDELLLKSPRELTSDEDKEKTYNISFPLLAGHRIDFFVSHSWNDDPVTKCQSLKDFCKHFEATFHRPPTLW